MFMLCMVTGRVHGFSKDIHETKSDMFGMTFVTMALYEVGKFLESNPEDEEDKVPTQSSVHVPGQFETESLSFLQPPPRPRPKFLLRHRRRLARNRAYTKSLIQSLPDDLKF
ncbi:uncharacterized protein [Argopecten irradians]|uniref:uncharacterized protein n=1 Tax=Argopecten irradians TaxID=31199 RepID=UPI00371D8470